MDTLLVPLDTSVTSEKVLAHAAGLARKLGAKILLLHVVEPVATYVPVGASMDVVTSMPPPDESEQTRGDLARLEEMGAPARASGVDISCKAVLGLAVDEILEQAKIHKAAYIVLGSHGHGALYHLFSGSVVTGVLKHSHCPVVVVPVK